MTVAEASRPIGIPAQTFYCLRKQYRGISSGQLNRLREIGKDNKRLRRAVSDLRSH